LVPAVADLSLLPRLWDPGEEAERFFEIGFFRDEKLLDAASFDDETLSCRPSTAFFAIVTSPVQIFARLFLSNKL
jgi:hypothetical protein